MTARLAGQPSFNVLIRLLTADDPQQAGAAKRLFESGSVWVSKTVLRETAWVLHSAYGFEDAAIGKAFTNLLGLDNLHAEDESSIATALGLMGGAIDFADAMHLAG
jgi:predicted nucleic-acid-binding protein